MQVNVVILNNGQEVQISDLNTIAQAAAFADDRVWAELLRLAPMTSPTPIKGILPYWFQGYNVGPQLFGLQATVMPGTGGVVLQNFRAVVGSRTSSSASDPNSLVNIRTQFYLGNGTASSTGTYTFQPLLANSSGNPRWDLVYAAVAVDTATPNVMRFIKSPTTKVVTQNSISVSLATSVTIGVVTGTPGATPIVPVPPVDSGGTFYIPLAAVRVVNGFTAASALSVLDIRDQAQPLSAGVNTGCLTVRPATGNGEPGQVAGTYNFDAAGANVWSPTLHLRPPIFLPSTFVGGESIFVELDCSVSGHPSHAQDTVVDKSVNWLNRFFITFVQFAQGPQFSNDSSISPATATAIPVVVPGNAGGPGAGGTTEFKMGNSFQFDAQLRPNGATVYMASNATSSTIFSASQNLGVYVDNLGVMRCGLANNPNVRMFLWIFASGPFPNR